MRSNQGQGLLALFGLLFGLFGAVGVVSQSRQLASHRPTDAVIRSARVVEHESTDSDHQTSVTYSPEIEFEYVVAGRTYTSRRVFPVEGTNSFRRSAQGWVDRFPPGRQVQAYYLPRKPSSAFLVRKTGFAPYVFLLIGLGVLMGALAMGNSRLTMGVGSKSGIGVGMIWLVLAGLAVVHYLYQLLRYR